MALTAMVVLGIWLAHPWRTRMSSPPRPETLLRADVTLAACTITLLAGHLTAIALDHYAGVGWIGAFVPWHATYRPTGVAPGHAGSLRPGLGRRYCRAGRLNREADLVPRPQRVRHNLRAHPDARSISGSDSHSLRWMYVFTGSAVAAVQVSRWISSYRASHLVPDLK